MQFVSFPKEKQKVMKTILLVFILVIIRFISPATNFNIYEKSFSDYNFEENTEKSDLKIYPNPCLNKKVTIEFYNELITEIKLTNIAGKTVLFNKTEIPSEKVNLQLNNVPNGMYLVQIKSESGKIKVSKLLVSVQ